jgi:hypothetical protein
MGRGRATHLVLSTRLAERSAMLAIHAMMRAESESMTRRATLCEMSMATLDPAETRTALRRTQP